MPRMSPILCNWLGNHLSRASMKMFVFFVAFHSLALCRAQEFVNLNFDSPDLSGSLRPVDPLGQGQGFFGSTSRLLRGWTLSVNGVSPSEITYSPWPLSTSTRGANLYTYPPFQLPNAENVNRLWIYGGGPGDPIVETRLWQTATIPIGVNGISIYGGRLGQVLVDGEYVGLTYSHNGGIQVVDLARFAGQNVRLEFAFQGGVGFFDILGFTQVPEPSTYAMCGLGLLFLAAAVKCQRRS
jgi:hypothetical protein